MAKNSLFRAYLYENITLSLNHFSSYFKNKNNRSFGEKLRLKNEKKRKIDYTRVTFGEN